VVECLANPCLFIDASEILRPEQWAAAGSTLHQIALRCQMALMASQGKPVLRIARELDVQFRTVLVWRDRIAEQGIGTVWNIAPGRGRKSHYDKS
jgi:hypothetical protein